MPRNVVTTVLDLLGLLGIVAAIALAVLPLSVPGAIASAGVGLLGVSWLIDARSRR